MRKIFLAFLWLFMAVPAHAAEAPHDTVQKIVSPKGIEIWLVEDHRLPIISLAFAFRGGMSLDPADKAGLANFVSDVLDEGAGPRDSETYQAALADNAISLSFSAGRDSFEGSVRTLTAHRDLTAELLHDALTVPHLDPKDVERMRDEIAAEIKRNMADPEWVVQRNFNNTVFNGHPYGQPGFGSLDTLARITPDDLRGYIKAHFGRDQLLVTATGDIDGKTLGLMADKIFDDLPDKAAAFTVPDITPKGGGQIYVIDKPIPESVLLLGAPGVKRDDPDWYAAEIMNYVLGGGGFNSRLMEEVRVKHALTYGIDSSLIPYQHAGLMIINGSTKNEDAAKALDLIKQELGRLQSGGITGDELKNAKTYLTGSIPLRMTSTMNVASTLLAMRIDRLPIDFLTQVDARLNAVTQSDVARVAQRLLDANKFASFVLGQPTGLKPTAPVAP
jgi:zinc protease